MLKAFVTGKTEDPDQLKRSLSKKLPEYMIPKVIEVIEKMPITENGKIDRTALENYD